ncbi:hypothetical protein EBU99_00220 [bacterium]|nr:hypothetical protein [bacterium]
MKLVWVDIVYNYLPVTAAISAQFVFLMLPVNLRTWRRDSLNAWTYAGIQLFVAGLLFIVIPVAFGLFKLSSSAILVALLFVFLGSWWRIVKSIPLEATFPVTPDLIEQPTVSFDSFYNADRLRQLGELPTDDPSALQRHRALRELLVRRRVDRNMGDSDDI